MHHTQPPRSRSFALVIASVAVLVLQGWTMAEAQARERHFTATGPEGQTGSVEVTPKP